MMRLTLAAALAVLALPATAQDIDNGAALYGFHCASCHGADATGNGPLAPALIVQPSDLTTMTARNGGTFPTFRAVSRIDGRDPLVSHGSPMPVYGPFFAGRDVPLQAETGQPIMTTEPVADLVAWLRTIQAE